MKLKKLAFVLGLAAFSAAAHAAFPEKAVTLVVPFAAGGPSDKIARDVAEALREPLGQSIIVENTVGAGGTIGTAKVARANPDGYTLLVHHIGMATAPALYKQLSYQVPDSFEFLGLINEAPSTLISRPTLAANNFDELRQWINENKDGINLANAGVGSASHLCGLMLQEALQVDMTTIAYKGTAPAMIDLMGGQVDLMCEQATNAVTQIEAGKVKSFGVTSTQRLKLPSMAAVPTLDESGLKGFNVTVWHGLYAPRNTPPEVLEKLNAALRAALKNPELIKRQEALGLSIIQDDRLAAAGHKKYVEDEMARWSKVIKDSGQQPN
ncbi:tripartite tricarboxylate transporter substrate-binding protein [Parapusillimonas sp. JC17]|uniref:tripartite tricarboxylate transporter substrate-binding protein n=1 Tax=Parapusillimonas sp. JC17 TaxID=3445768 RepID=UPI003FA0B62A